MQLWIGKAVIIIGVIHSVFGFVFFFGTIANIFDEGVFNTVNGQPVREAVFWFLFSGFLIILFGMLINWVEGEGIEIPRFVGWSLLLLTIVTVAIMPISGGWLVFVPATGAIAKHHKS